jgi:glycosyltransferase involved in cell wall biosynthesis
MDNKYKISVIVPCLNAGATIANCINSILMQEYSNFEIIVIDGLSTDETINIVNRLIADGDHKIISGKDDGIYDAINKGIDMASGDYLIVLGSDDVFYDNKVLNRVFLSDFKYADLIYGNVIFKSTNAIYDGKFNIIKLMTKNICHQSIFYHKSVYEKLGKYDTKYKALADVLFNIRCFESGDITIRYIDEIISIYNDKGYSSTHSDTAYWENLTENLKKYCSEEVLNYQTTTRKIANLNQALAERDASLSERDALLSERDASLSERDALLSERESVIRQILSSNSWRITAPLRFISTKLRALLQKPVANRKKI